MSEPVALLVFGLVVLAAGSELFTRGLGWLARAFGDGQPADFFVVAAVSSAAPVLAVCLAAGLSGYPRVAFATVIGCNIANVGLVLGLSTVVRPLAAQLTLLRPGIAGLIGVTLLVWFLARDEQLDRVDGAWLMAAAVVAVAAVVRRTAGQKSSPPSTTTQAVRAVGWVGGVLLLAGVAALTGGAALMVRSFAEVVPLTGVGGITVAVTVLAPAITFRSLVAGVTAARRGEGDGILGGVVGAGVVNLIFGVGLIALTRTIPVPDRLLLNELPALALSTLLLLPVVMNGLRARRWEGVVLLAAYTGFIAWVMWGTR